MQAYIANQIMEAFDSKIAEVECTAAGKANYVAWFGTVAKQRLYHKYELDCGTILETTISAVTHTDYSSCIVPYVA